MNQQLISYDWADRIVHAHDASVYRMVPHAVARPQSLDDVRALIAMARDNKFGLTFRAGGTSLSGQAVTHDLLVVLGRAWDWLKIENDGLSLSCGPALRGAVANASLSRFGRRIGPDPASIQAACLGGIVANNASGMCCGVEENSYRTIEGIKLLLATGTVLDTRSQECEHYFRANEPSIYSGLMNLRDKILSSERLVELIRRKSSGKNTTGYGLQAFLDYSTAREILTHLLVGSEGTLAFMAEMTLRSVPLRPHRASALLSFEQIEDACEVTPQLRDLGFSAIELLDYESVQAIREYPQLPAFLKDMNKRGACLLLQAQEEDGNALSTVIENARVISGWRQISNRTEFFSDAQRQSQLWDLRKGIFPAVGARRPRGTSVIIEDVAFPLGALAEGTRALRSLLEKHEYHDAVIYGHARDGNLHFVLSQNFASDTEIRRYEKFIDDMVECVAGRFAGALKAEHGTGRNMAPFVEKEWGSEAYGIMCELKRIFDPENIFNPGVLINSNPRVHLENLKITPLIDESLDACIECGFCEPVCPSQGLTLTPRGRIALQRERSQTAEKTFSDDSLLNYLLLDTCAADGLCAQACPVGINTGSWVKKMRGQSAAPSAQRFAEWVSDEMSAVETAAKISVRSVQTIQKVVGADIVSAAAGWIHSTLGAPAWSEHLIRESEPRFHSADHLSGSRHPSGSAGAKVPVEKQKVIHLRTCVTRTLGGREQALEQCALRAGVEIIDVSESGMCCGQPWSSKGFKNDATRMLGRWIDRAFELSQQGSFPIVVDNSPCAQTPFEDADGLSELQRSRLSQLQIWDPIDLSLYLARRLELKALKEPVRFFPVCSVVKSGRRARFEELARMLCENPIFPLQTACCGMAGDRGLWFPELTANAAARFHWSEKKATRGFCSSRTCEIALSRDQMDFDSIYVALEMASRASSMD